MVSFLAVTGDDVREFERKRCGLYEGTADIIRLIESATNLHMRVHFVSFSSVQEWINPAEPIKKTMIPRVCRA